MKISWLGHACFMIETEKLKILTDPFNEGVGYPLFQDTADIVTVSHDHWDHNAVQLVKGNPFIIDQAGSYNHKDICIKGVASFHDKNQGKDRGANIIYKISAEGINLVHLGDLGHILNSDQIEQIGSNDILFLPVGGNYTIDAREAYEIAEILKPKIVIPMHFKTAVNSFAIDPVEVYTAQIDQFVKKPFLQISHSELSYPTRVVVLDYPVK